MTVQELLKAHPDWPAVEIIYHRLLSHGYKAFLAGGCVRDALRGQIANDLDLASDARPEEIENLFEKTVPVGKSFGVIRVLEGSSDIEVASFRTDGVYQDGRRPDQVTWASPEDDAKRRDFTVNALFWDLQSEVVVDYVQGLQDLAAQTLRAVGPPLKRFEEDHLRLLRAVRFAGQLGFTIETNTYNAICKNASFIKSVSGERLREEMTKLLISKERNLALKLLHETSLQKQIFPEISQARQIRGSSFKEPWQAWVLFWEGLAIEAVQGYLQKLKFSNKENEWIKQALLVLQTPQAFLSQRLGKQLVGLTEAGTEYAFSLLIERSLFLDQVTPIEQQWLKLKRTLPEPFLRGHDVRHVLAGPKIGECLDQAYFEQLEDKILTRDQSLLWLEKFLKN